MKLLVRMGVALAAVVAVLIAPSASAQHEEKASPVPSLPEIVKELDSRSWARAGALQQFEGTRTYTMQYHGFPSGQAEIVVAVQYQAPATKSFRIISQSGSKLIIDHVFKPMLESERQGASDPSRVETTSRNYDFSFVGIDHTPGGDQYILSAVPKRKDRLLFRGRVWVDALDFAVVKIDGEPAENPSIWIKRTEIHHNYKKVGAFWLPAENRSVSYLRLGGHAELSIEYGRYAVKAAEPVPSADVEVGSGAHAQPGISEY